MPASLWAAGRDLVLLAVRPSQHARFAAALRLASHVRRRVLVVFKRTNDAADLLTIVGTAAARDDKRGKRGKHEDAPAQRASPDLSLELRIAPRR